MYALEASEWEKESDRENKYLDVFTIELQTRVDLSGDKRCRCYWNNVLIRRSVVRRHRRRIDHDRWRSNELNSLESNDGLWITSILSFSSTSFSSATAESMCVFWKTPSRSLEGMKRRESFLRQEHSEGRKMRKNYEMFVKVCVCVSVRHTASFLFLLLSQYIWCILKIPLKTSVFDTRRVEERKQRGRERGSERAAQRQQEVDKAVLIFKHLTSWFRVQYSSHWSGICLSLALFLDKFGDEYISLSLSLSWTS